MEIQARDGADAADLKGVIEVAMAAWLSETDLQPTKAVGR